MEPLPIKNSRKDIYDFISPTRGVTKDAAAGKSVLVTGAGSGIGREIAIYFAIAGASSITLVGRTPADLEETKAKILADHSPGGKGCEVTCVPTDCTDPAAVKALFRKTTGKVDVLVNNAGSVGQIAPMVSVNDDRWWSAFEINIRGTHLMSTEWLRRLAGGPGILINISSRSSYVTAATMSSYQISKSALNRHTEFVDKEHASQGVVAFALHPGGVPGTRLSDDVPDWLVKNLTDTPALSAATCLYLTLPRARWLSGRYIPATWDMEELEALRERILSEDLLKIRVTGIDDRVLTLKKD